MHVAIFFINHHHHLLLLLIFLIRHVQRVGPQQDVVISRATDRHLCVLAPKEPVVFTLGAIGGFTNLQHAFASNIE